MKRTATDEDMKKRFQKVLRQMYCMQCKTNVPLVDYDAWIDQGGVILKGKCGLCGGQVSRLIEAE